MNNIWEQSMYRRYNFKLKPTPSQENELFQNRFLTWKLYNALIEQRNDAWDRCKISLNRYSQGRECTLLRHDDVDYKNLGSSIMERCSERVETAFKKYFDNVKKWRSGQWNRPYPPSPPSYQKLKSFSGFGCREDGKGWKLFENSVRLQNITNNVKIMGEFPAVPDKIKTCDVLYRHGEWFISIAVEYTEIEQTTSVLTAEIHLDLLTEYGQLNDSSGFNDVIQISSAIPKKGSRGAKNRVNRQHKANQQRDFHIHQLTSELAAKYRKITIYRPKLLEVVESAKGDKYNHGVFVSWKAKETCDFVRFAAGKFCEALTYKLSARKAEIEIIETNIHPTMIPIHTVRTAKFIKQQMRRKLKKNEGMNSST